jgi:hypothetical protein
MTDEMWARFVGRTKPPARIDAAAWHEPKTQAEMMTLLALADRIRNANSRPGFDLYITDYLPGG